MLPEAVVCLPGRTYRLRMAGKNLDDDQLNAVSCGTGKPMLEAGKKTPSNLAIIDENTAPKTRRKQGFLRNCDLAQPPMILQDQTSKRSTPKHKDEKHRPCPARQQRNTFHTCHDSIGIAVAICYTIPAAHTVPTGTYAMDAGIAN
jgi:hypothetical protein